MQAWKGMDDDENVRNSMRRAFEQVCLAPINGSVLTLEPPIFLMNLVVSRAEDWQHRQVERLQR